MSRVFLLFFLAFILPSAVFGQRFEWHRTLPVSCRSVAFNPLSKGRILFAGPGRDNFGVYRSDDGGTTWTLHSTDTLSVPMNNIHQVFCVPSDTNVVLAVSPNQLYRSTDGGTTWNMLDSLGGVDGENIAWHAIGDTVYYGQNFGYALWKSGDHGATWQQTGFANPDSIGLCALDVSQDSVPTIIQGATDSGFLAYTTDDGEHWDVTLRKDTNGETEVPKVVFSNYAMNAASGRHDVALAIRWLSTYRSLVATTNGGVDWIAMPSPSIYPWALDLDQRASKVSQRSDAAYPLPLHYFIGLFGVQSDIENSLIQETTDGGMTWRSTNFPLFGDTNHHYIWILKYDTTTGHLAAATDSGIYIADTITSSVANDLKQPTSDVTITQHSGIIEIEADHSIVGAMLFDILGRAVQCARPEAYDAWSFSLQSNNCVPGVYALEVMLPGAPPMFRMLIIP